ncbi:acetyl-CoA carboxylase biotin carboxyl carrier protein [Amycolatopsis thermoflava]|uniref:acetyl-CoA carboxylase biotin carboxyl carrier protein n=1 Tax=Amycolatopsis thermoflava TaxID=84480 RepID=UPI0037F4B38D
MTLSPADIKLIVGTLQDSEWDEAEVVVGDVRIAVARNGASLGATAAPARAAAPAPAPAAPGAAEPQPVAVPAPEPAADQGGGHVVTSPSVGVFWRAPEPGAKPFVEVGATVAAGDTIGIVEVMKLMSNVTTDVAGTVTAVHVENAGTVEFGTPLVTIRPES